MATQPSPAPSRGIPPQQGGRQQQQQQRRPQSSGRGRGGRGGRGRGRSNSDSTDLAPGSGVPYGHVPAYLSGSSSLVEDLDKRIMIVLRDGRHLIGILRSFDQFSNMVLNETVERKFVNHDKVVYYCDVPMGVHVIRGDSVVLFGQVGPTDNGMKKVSDSELDELTQKAEENSSDPAVEWECDKDLSQ